VWKNFSERILKIFPGEVSKSQLFSWKKKGLLCVDAGIEDKEVKPKFEKVVRSQRSDVSKPISRRQAEILKMLEEKRDLLFRTE